jgi:DNA-binding transcriptional MerR regulator
MAKENEIKKAIKEERIEFNKDVKRHMGVFLEEFQERVKAIREQYSDIQEKLANLSADVQQIKHDQSNIRFWMVTTEDKVVDKKLFVDLESRVRKLEKVK